MPSEPRPPASRLLLWVGLVVSLGLVVVGLIEHWNLALPVSGLLRLAQWIVTGVYSSVPILAIGWLVTHWVDRQSVDHGPLQTVAMAWATGWIVIMLTGLPMLAAGVYTPLAWQILAPAVWLGLLAWSISTRWRALTTLLDGFRNPDRQPARLFSWEALLALAAAAATLHASLPPDTRDELSYHLVAPQLWGFQGNWWVPIDNFHLLFPGNTEIIWGWASSVAGPGASRFVTLIFALAAVALLADWMCRAGIELWIRRLSLVFLLVTPVVLTTASICYVEWPMLFFLILGWRLSRQALHSERSVDVTWTSVFWAATLGMKYTAAIFVAPLFGEWLLALYRRRPRRAVLAAGGMMVAAIMLAGPWMVRNWMATGDPVYPLGEPLGFAINSPHDAEALSHYSDVEGLWRWMPWLYHATAEPIGDHRLHPLWPLLHVAVLFFGWRWRRELPWFSVLFSTIVLAWFTPAPRIYLPLMLLVWLFLPALLSTLPGSPRDRAVASISIGFMAIVSLPIALHFMFAPGGRAVPDHLLGVTSVTRYLQDRGLVGPTMQWVAENTDPDARVWAWCEDRTLYLDRWTRSDSPYGPPSFLRIVETGGVQALDEEIRQQGIDYILLRRERCPESWTEAVLEKHKWDIDQPSQKELADWSSARLQELSRDSRHVLYRLQP